MKSRKKDRSPGTRSRDGFMDTGPMLHRLIGGPLSLPDGGHSRDADGVGLSDLCPCLEPGDNWTDRRARSF